MQDKDLHTMRFPDSKKNYAVRTLAGIVVASLFCGSPLLAQENDTKLEYKLKAALLYNFLLFSESPDSSSSEDVDTVTIGILGNAPFNDAFQPIEGKTIREKKLVIQKFEEGADIESLKKCRILFISDSEKDRHIDIIRALQGEPVLTVSETEGFLDTGGMINLVKQDNSVKFEVNTGSAKSAGIRFRSKLLRIAIRVETKAIVPSKDPQNG
jgi:hypothetical protein